MYFFFGAGRIFHATIPHTMIFWIIVPTSFVILMALLFTYAYGGLKAAPWVPMRKRDIERVFQVAPIEKGDCVYDLGCGDARVLVGALVRGVGRAVGYEVSLIPYGIAWLRGRRYGKKMVLRYRDFWKADVSEASVIFLFLSHRAHARLGKKFNKELKKGTRVVTYVWPIEGWGPVSVDKSEGKLPIYLYEK
jgi:tRNA A58 N-methylase Trm61